MIQILKKITFGLVFLCVFSINNITFAEEDESPINLYGFENTHVFSETEVKNRLIEQLNTLGTLPAGMEVKGKVKNEDGTYSVAIIAQEGKNEQEVVVNVDENGKFQLENLSRFNLGADDREIAEKAYHYVLDNNEMTDEELSDLNSSLATDIKKNIKSIAEKFNIPEDKAAQTTSGAFSMLGLAIFGATGTRKKQTTPEPTTSSGESNSFTRSGYFNTNPTWSGERDENGIAVRGVSSLTEPCYGDGTTGMFNNCLDDEEKYEGMTTPTKIFLCKLTTRFYAETGIVVNLTSGYRPYDTGSCHSVGIAFDVTADEFEGENGKYYRQIYENIVMDMGGTPLDEYPGEPGAIYARGSNFHVTVHNQW